MNDRSFQVMLALALPQEAASADIWMEVTENVADVQRLVAHNITAGIAVGYLDVGVTDISLMIELYSDMLLPRRLADFYETGVNDPQTALACFRVYATPQVVQAFTSAGFSVDELIRLWGAKINVTDSINYRKMGMSVDQSIELHSQHISPSAADIPQDTFDEIIAFYTQGVNV